MKNKYRFSTSIFVSLFVFLSASALAQKQKVSLRESVDGAFDMSDYLSNE